MTDFERNLIYIIYEGFGGACSYDQSLKLCGGSSTPLDNLIDQGYLKKYSIDDTDFIICCHKVYTMAGNESQNYRITAYNLKKSCLLAEYWLQRKANVDEMANHLPLGTMHQRTMGPMDEHIDYLHRQNIYVWQTDLKRKRRDFVYFPKSNDWGTIAKTIMKFYDNQGLFDDVFEVTPYLEVIVPNKHTIANVQSKLSGKYWWVNDQLTFTVLSCEATKDLI